VSTNPKKSKQKNLQPRIETTQARNFLKKTQIIEKNKIKAKEIPAPVALVKETLSEMKVYFSAW